MEADLPTEHIFQGAYTNTCGPCCVAMVYALRKLDIGIDDILRDFKQDAKGEATYVPQLARHMQKNGLKTRIFVSSSKIASPAWSKLAKHDLLENFKEWLAIHPKDEWHHNNLYMLFYLQEGGDLTLESYTAQSMKEMLDRGSTVIACIDENWVWGHRTKRPEGEDVQVDDVAGTLGGHFVVLTGYSENKFHVLDPFPTNIPDRYGAYDVDVAQLANASLTWDPQIIEVPK